MALCQLFDYTMHRIPSFVGGLVPGVKGKPAVGMTAGTLFLAASIVVFTLYAPLTYGNQWTRSECQKVKLFDTWDWDCNIFPIDVRPPKTKQIINSSRHHC